MALTKSKAIYLGELLAFSPIKDDIKNLILEKLEEMSEVAIDQIISSLENERMMLNDMMKDFDEFEAEQEKDWEKLAVQQQEVAEKLIKEKLEKIDDEKVEEIKKQIKEIDN
ncbi:MAG: hypothetical protein ACOCU8_01480 [Patescibacteria group bacterium]